MLPDRPDVKILKALADDIRLRMLLVLLVKPATQKELGALARIPSGSSSRHLGELEKQGLIVRERAHGPYHVVHPQQTRRLIQLANALAQAIAEAHSALATKTALEVNRDSLQLLEEEQGT